MRKITLVRVVSVAAPVLVAAATVTASTALAQPGQTAAGTALTAAQAQALSSNVTDHVIVVMKDQVTSQPDTPANASKRAASIRQSQQGVRSVMSQTHATHVHSLSLVNAVTATVSPGTAQVLAASPDVQAVIPDRPIPVVASPTLSPGSTGTAAGAGTPARGAGGANSEPLSAACAANGQVQLDPEAIEAIHAASAPGGGPSAQSLGYTGAGVKVGFIADGVDPQNPDFIRPDGQPVFADYQDFSGTGTNAPTNGGEAFLDASSIAAQGREVYNLSELTGASQPCNIRILGVAPGASLVGLNVFGSANVAFNSVFLEAINYAVNVDHVNVLNESFGDNPFPDTASLDLVKEANDAAVAAGVTVDVSSGDAGVTNTIGSPSTDPGVISAGASTTYRAYAQVGLGGIDTPGVTGWLDNNISGLSSGGFDQSGGTVDVVAPGDLNWALCTPNPQLFAACNSTLGVELTGGTSEAAPLTSGTAALVIQAYRQTHHGATPSPAVVKQIIVSTAQNIDAPADQQGAGMIDAYQAVLAARSYHGATAAPSGHAILDSATQLNKVAAAGTTQHFTETLTNDGASRTTVGLSTRTLSAYRPVSTQSLSLTAAEGYSTEVTFTVPPGQARLNAAVSLSGLVELSLISPAGDFAEYNLPQGFGNYGDTQVADPQPGTWTALIVTSGDGSDVPAQFQASVATWQTFGSLSAHSLSLAPGASGTVTLTVSTPRQPGDQAGSIQVTSAGASPSFTAVTSIPVTLRSLVPAPHPSVTVTGTLTGGNGRASNTGQTAYYQVQVPRGMTALNASVSTGNAGNTLFAELVDPSGAAASAASSSLTQGGAVTPEDGTQLHVLDPVPGLWTIIVDFYNSVSGTAVSQPFTISLNDIPVAARASGLPGSARTRLPAGKPVTALVTVHNSGSSPEAYFVDARLASQATMSLAPQTTATLTLPNVTGVVPTFLVPSHASSITATASATAPLFFDFSYPFGDPDLISSTGTTATGTWTAPDISAGDYTVTPFLTGPTGSAPAPNVTASVSMTATAPAFDSAVSAPTGDLWQQATDASAAFTPVVVGPGQSATIPVTITPQGAPGTVVSGTLYLADYSLVSGAVTYNELPGNYAEGSDVAAFSYRYTVG